MKKSLLPPPKMDLVEWADKYRKLSRESSSTGGSWRTENVEVARGPMLAVTEPSIQTISVMACTQLLKALDVNTPLPTPTGWTTMGEVQAGDKLFDEAGNVCNVLGVTEIMTRDKCFEVEFSDGAIVTCDEGHKWTVDDQPRRLRNLKKTTINTGDMFKTFQQCGRNRYAIPVAQALELPEQELTIDPYLLGVWLGDGHSYSCNLTIHENDYQIVEELALLGTSVETTGRTDTGVLNVHLDCGKDYSKCRRGHAYKDTGYTKHGYCAECSRQSSMEFKHGTERDDIVLEQRTFGERLAALGLIKGHSAARRGNKKHIPEIYERASKAQRFELLKGLMDTDGTIGVDGRPSFSTNNKHFAQQVLELLASLGLKGRIYRNIAMCNGKDCGFAYNVSFMAYSDTPVFKLDRKRHRQVSQEGRRVSETKRRRIVDVRIVAAVPVKCLAVDSPSHLYLCGREMIPTHNTELILNTAGYFIHQDPCPMLVIQPNDNLVEVWSKDRFDSMRRDSPAIAERVHAARAKDSGTTRSRIEYDGGQMSIVGANSPVNVAARPIRIVMADEIDKFPASAGKEGDPLVLAEERAGSFWNKKFIRTCSPTVQGASRIETEYLDSDQRKPFIACPHCDVEQILEFERVKWDKSLEGDHLTETAQYTCISCEKPWPEAVRSRMLRTKGTIKWKQTAPFKCCGKERIPQKWNSAGRSLCDECGKLSKFGGHAGFWASQLYSPWHDLATIAKKWVSAVKSKKANILKTFYNTQLGLPFQEAGEAPEWKRLYDRRDNYSLGTVPRGALFLTAGVDIQRDRVELHVWGWGRGLESWLVDVQVFEGATADIKSPAWSDLEIALRGSYPHEAGSQLGIFRAAVDTGDGLTTSVVYEWCRRQSGGQVLAIKGDREKDAKSSPVNGPTFVDVSERGRKVKKGLKLWHVTGAYFKSELYRQLNLDKPLQEDLDVGVTYPDGYVHLPGDVYGEWVEQLVAETLMVEDNKKTGFKQHYWKAHRDRNEAMDCRVYARAMAMTAGVDRWPSSQWAKLEARLGANIEPVNVAEVIVDHGQQSLEAEQPQVQPPKQPPAQANDNKPKRKIKKRRQSWI